jgi:1-acyl-sn-glycerol-3-phosphate acyltransferase
MIKSIFIILWIILNTVVFSLVAISVSFFSQTGNSVHIVGRLWGKSILWAAGIKIQVRGLENFDPDKPFVFMCNHQSNFDILVLFSALPAQFRWIAKAELFRIPLFGRAMRGAGYISIERKDRKKAIRSLKQAAKRIKTGTSVMIFPEGTRSPDGNIGEFKKGGFVLAYDAGVPITPIVINGTWSIMSKDSLRIKPGNVTLSILPAVNVADYPKTEKPRLINDVRENILKEFEANKTLIKE